MIQLAKPGGFYLNKECLDYQKLQSQSQKNIIKVGWTKAGITCHHTFTETKGTLFYRKRTSADKVLETLAFIGAGNRISSLSRVKGVKEDTLLSWLREAAQHVQAVNDISCLF